MIALIPTINRSPLLGALLDVLVSDGVEVIIIDGSDEHVAKYPGVTRLRAKQNIYKSWNHGLDAGSASGENVLILNDDIILQPGAAMKMDALLSRSEFGIVSFFDVNRLDQLRIKRAHPDKALVATTPAAIAGKGHAICGYAFAANPAKCARCDEGFLWWCGDDDLFYATVRNRHHVGVALGIEVQHPTEGTSSDGISSWLPYGWKAHDFDRLESNLAATAPTPSMAR